MKNFLAELIGTFVLVFAGTGAIIVNQLYGGIITHSGVSLIFGLAVTSMIYSFGSVSQAHLNPAVTLVFTMTREFSVQKSLYYIAAQLLGSFSVPKRKFDPIAGVYHQPGGT